MTDRQLKQYRMFVRVRQFGTTHLNRFREGTIANEAFTAVANSVSQLEAYAAERLTTKRRKAKERALARAALLRLMERISRAAVVLARRDRNFVNTFLMPVRESAEVVLTTARVFARDVEPLAPRFRERAFSNTFPEDFKQLLERYESAFREREEGKALTAEALAIVEEAIDSGLHAVRELDIIVANELGDDPVATAKWRSSRRVGYAAAKEPPNPEVQPADSAVVPLALPTIPPTVEDAVAPADSLAPLSETTPVAADTVEAEAEADVGVQADADAPGAGTDNEHSPPESTDDEEALVSG